MQEILREVNVTQVGELVLDVALVDLIQKLYTDAGVVEDCMDEDGSVEEDGDVTEMNSVFVMHLFRRLGFARSRQDIEGRTFWLITDHGRDELRRTGILS
jgi:hypothetical protein